MTASVIPDRFSWQGSGSSATGGVLDRVPRGRRSRPSETQRVWANTSRVPTRIAMRPVEKNVPFPDDRNSVFPPVFNFYNWLKTSKRKEE